MSRHSVIKGKSGEREFCNVLAKLLGVNMLVRNLEQCRSGGYDLMTTDKHQADPVLFSRLDEFSIEIKRYREGRPGDINQWWQQAVKQARTAKKNPLLAFRLDRQQWNCLIHLGNFELENVHGCITMDITLFADILKNGTSDAPIFK